MGLLFLQLISIALYFLSLTRQPHGPPDSAYSAINCNISRAKVPVEETLGINKFYAIYFADAYLHVLCIDEVNFIRDLIQLPVGQLLEKAGDWLKQAFRICIYDVCSLRLASVTSMCSRHCQRQQTAEKILPKQQLKQ